MTTRHTAGEWRTDGRRANECPGIDRDGRNWQVYVEADNSTVIARCHGATQEEAEANARLIAAVPDLLRVVESVFLWDLSKDIGKGKRKPSPLYPSIVEAAREALKKAGV